MVRLGTRIVFLLLLVAALALVALQADGQAAPAPQPATTVTPTAATAQPAATVHKTRMRGHAKKDPVPEIPQPPPPPPTLEQTPPTPPQVTYQNGELTIDAHNSTLSQVLHAVQSQTGASVEMPAGAGNDRVVAQIGPGQPHDVLNTLLNGSKFDYVILGVMGNPGAVQKVILSVRQAGSTTPTAAQNTPPQAEQTDEDVPVAENGEQEYPNQYGSPRPPIPGGFRRPIPGQANVPPAEQQQNTYSGPGGEAQNNGGKTPEQLMQELQEMQQQQQQYQEQLNPANREPQ